MYTEIESLKQEVTFPEDFMSALTEIAGVGVSSTTPRTPKLDELMPIEARAVIRAKSGKGKTGKVSVAPESAESDLAAEFLGEQMAVSSLAGEDSYDRPNGEVYYARKWGDHSDIEVLRKAREAGQFVMLYGNPGTGKTAAVEAAFPDELYTILGSGDTEVADLVGGYVQTPSGGFEWVDGNLVRAAEEGKVLLIDEIGLIDPKVLSVVYGLMDGRRELVVTANPERGVVKAKEGFWVVAATNPNAPGVRLSEALLSRFTIQAEMTTDWSRAKEMGVPNAAVVAAQNLSKKMENGETSWSPQFRELLAFKKNAELFGTKWAVANLLAAAPEIDRPVAAEVFARVFGDSILPARI